MEHLIGKHKRGEIYLVDFSNTHQNSIQTGIRPAIILQNNKGNSSSKTTIVVPLTSASKFFELHPAIKSLNSSYALPEQIRVIDNSRLKKKIGEVTEEELISIIEVLKNIVEFNSDSEIVYVKLEGIGSEHSSLSPIPCLVLQKKQGFRYSTTLIVAPISSGKGFPKVSTQVKLPVDETNERFKYDSYVLFEQTVVIPKNKIKSKQYKNNFNEHTLRKLYDTFLYSIS